MTVHLRQGVSQYSPWEFCRGHRWIIALDDARQDVDEFRQPAADAERPEVIRVARFDPIATWVIYGPYADHELRALAYRYEREPLLARGIDRIDIRGLPPSRSVIEVPNSQLHS